MTERTGHDASVTACPFVAFVDDRDERADVPDHRHRCYAEIRPAQRALAHQQAFCLSAGFAQCPTFQDWARRESARARSAASSQRQIADAPEIVEIEPAAAVAAAAAAGIDPDPEPEDVPFDDRASRNPHRDWADPPPWTDPGLPMPGPETDAPGFLVSRSPASEEGAVAAAGLSASRWLQDVPPPRETDEALAPTPDTDDELERALAEDRANRELAALPPVGASGIASSSRAARRSNPPAAPQTVSSARRRTPERAVAGPSWERPRRYEAYPTLKTRIGLPSIPRIGLAALAVVVAAAVLFFLPFLLRGGGQSGGVVASPTPSVAASAAASPTVAAPATPKVYVVKAGDTLLKIAKRFGLTVDQLLAANKQITNPNKIAVGDEIIIPVAAPSEVVNGASTEPSASP